MIELRDRTFTIVPMFALILSAHIVAGAGDNWPQFRGARAGVAADDPALPDTWSATENIVWKIDVPGRGWSSPIVWGDHVFISSAVNTKEAEAALKPVPTDVPRSVGGPIPSRSRRRSPPDWSWYSNGHRSSSRT